MQQRFWPDPQPLVERLGRDFFRNLPERPGVYLMRDAGEVVLYVGKAKNLRKRLGSYRVANPERMARRHLRLLRGVVRIELQECADEQAALAREAELLRTLKPRFNRAGTWPGKARFLAWNTNDDAIQFAITESPQAGWNQCGPMGAGAFPLCALLARLLWLAMNRAGSVERLPEGWAAGRTIPPVACAAPAVILPFFPKSVCGLPLSWQGKWKTFASGSKTVVRRLPRHSSACGWMLNSSYCANGSSRRSSAPGRPCSRQKRRINPSDRVSRQLY